jgi:DNA-binding NarL/FixJ family response regulator
MSASRVKTEPTADCGKIRLLLVNDHPILYDGLRALLERQADLEVIGQARNGDEAVRVVAAEKPDILLLDGQDPECSNPGLVRRIREANASSRPIVISVPIGKEWIVRLLQSGVCGVILKDSPSELLFKCLRRVHAGEIWVGRETMADVVHALASLDNANSAPPRHFRLTKRERTVVMMIVEGDTNKGIAKRLSVGEDTVKHHLTSIFDKTGTSNRLELALLALHHRIVEGASPAPKHVERRTR